MHIHFVFCNCVVRLFKFGDQLIDAVCLCVTDGNCESECAVKDMGIGERFLKFLNASHTTA